MARLGLPNLGFGVGLRPPHLADILSGGPNADWFEIISENFMDNEGYTSQVLDQLVGQVPLVMHGVSLSIGGTSPLNRDYLHKLKALAKRVKPVWISDHLCWTGLGSHNSHDLLPLPFNEQTLQHLIQRVHQVQDVLERPLILENPSSYIQFRASTMKEWEFITALVDATNCGLLLDVNNVYVNAHNHNFDAQRYIRAIPHKNVVQIHLAGPTLCGEYMIDTHDSPVPTRVWELYLLAQQLTGGVSTLLEWDANIPSYQELLAELDKARQLMSSGILPVVPLYQANTVEQSRLVSAPIDFQLGHIENGTHTNADYGTP
jgi:uncharacterized protein (UPF0276 family)